MKKIFLLAVLSISLPSIYAQNCPANDSVSMGPGSGTDVFYSLKKANTIPIIKENRFIVDRPISKKR